jgi:FkbM family methyltransferase
MEKSLAFLIKPLLNLLAKFIKLSKHNVYYLVAGPLKKEIREASALAFFFEHIETAILLAQRSNLISNSIILDIGGGNATTAKVFNAHYQNLPIYIFEPIKSHFETIETSKWRNTNWVLFNKAVGSSSGTSTINVAKRSTASSLLQLDNKNSVAYQDVLQLQNTETIQITTIDTEVASNLYVEVMKLDVQGFELEVLKGAINTLPRTKVVVLEVNNHGGFVGAPTYYELDEFLRQQGFLLYDLYPAQRKDGLLLDWDAIYVNQQYRP